MTIEIKQLVIRAVADAHPADTAHRAGPLVAAPAPAPHRPMPAAERESIVAACVREVLRKLERSRER